MDYQKLAERVLNLVILLEQENPLFRDQVNTMKRSIRKYGVDPDKLAGGIGEPADYRKIILQIITDLRYSKGTSYDFDERDDYARDNYALHDITALIEKETSEFNDPELEFINIANLDTDDYMEIIREYQLIN